jgi:hypothetical protein
MSRPCSVRLRVAPFIQPDNCPAGRATPRRPCVDRRGLREALDYGEGLFGEVAPAAIEVVIPRPQLGSRWIAANPCGLLRRLCVASNLWARCADWLATTRSAGCAERADVPVNHRPDRRSPDDLRAALIATAGPENPAARAFHWRLAPPRHHAWPTSGSASSSMTPHTPVSAEVTTVLGALIDRLGRQVGSLALPDDVRRPADGAVPGWRQASRRKVSSTRQGRPRGSGGQVQTAVASRQAAWLWSRTRSWAAPFTRPGRPGVTV